MTFSLIVCISFTMCIIADTSAVRLISAISAALSAIRSISVTILSAAETLRRSLATGCSRSIIDRHWLSMFFSSSSTALSPSTTFFARTASLSRSAVIAEAIASSIIPPIRIRSLFSLPSLCSNVSLISVCPF